MFSGRGHSGVQGGELISRDRVGLCFYVCDVYGGISMYALATLISNSVTDQNVSY
jgi:hypothetical protein